MVMTIDKAIEILNGPEPDIDGILNDDYKDAVKLGIEALKRVKDMRISPCTTSDEILPGEAEE